MINAIKPVASAQYAGQKSPKAASQKKSELPLADWRKRELDKRYKEYKAGKLNLHDWKSVHEGLRNEY